MQAAAPTRSNTRRIPLPTSFGGVAAVSEGPGSWLLVWQFLFALATAIVADWAFDVAWGRGLDRAISALPDQGRIQDGILEWPDSKPQILHQGPFIAVVVDPVGLRENGLATDVTISLESDRLAIRSFLGWTALSYPTTFRLSLTRVDMTSMVAAWKTPFFLTLGLATIIALFVSWTLLSVVYGIVVWIGGSVLGRPVRFRTARRLAGASLLPGCLLMATAIALYATRQLGLEGLFIALPLQIVLGWVYCAGAWTRLRRPDDLDDSFSSNPFSDLPAEPADSTTYRPGASANPFQPRG